MMKDKIIEIKNLNVSYLGSDGPVRVLRDLSMSVVRGSITGIAGESGAGKSTLAAAMQNIFLPPAFLESGSVTFNGMNLYDIDEDELMSMKGTKISYMPQAAMNSLNPTRKIIQIFNDIMVSHGMNINENLDTVYEAMDLAEITRDALWMYPHQLSGGMKQRAVLALSTFMKPEVLILDEPTTGLDVIVQHEILKSIKKVQRSRDLTMILITHDIAILYEVSDYVHVVYGGKVVESGEYSRLLEKPSHPYTYMLLASVPSLKRKNTKLKRIQGEPISFTNYPKGCNFSPRCPYSRDMCITSDPPVKYIDEENFYSCFRYPEWTGEKVD
jgi:peptide/nickel transport system ATP-binding protein